MKNIQCGVDNIIIQIMSQRQVQKVKQIQQMKNGRLDKEEDEEAEYQSNRKQYFNAFAFQQDEDEEEEEEENNRQQDSKQQQQQDNKQQTGNKKKKKKKKKKKEEDEVEVQDDKNKQDMAYLDEMIKDIVPENDDLNNDIMKQHQQKLMEELKLRSILELNVKKLNYNKELKKYFKSEDMEPEQNQNEQMGLNRQQKKRLRQLENQREYKSYKHYYLIYNLKVYKNQVPDRFECEYIDIDDHGHKVYKFTPSAKYQSLQQSYQSLKNTLDPNNIFIFHQQNPFHANCLYDIAEYLRMQANYKDSNQLLEQLLFLYEESMNVEFKQNIFECNDGSNQYVKMVLKYDEISELFFRGLLKFIDVLVKKGCYQAAMEYNKVLLKLNPSLDPVGALLCIDYTTLLSRNYTYLYHFVRSFSNEVYRNDTTSILYLPNMIYSCSLAKYLDQQQKNNQIIDNSVFNDDEFEQSIDQSLYHLDCSANTLLVLSILLYPSIIKQMLVQTYATLFNHAFFTENDKPVQFYEYLDMKDDQDVKGLERIVSVYERNQSLWRQKEVGEWARKGVLFVLRKIDQGWNYEQFLADRLSLPFSKAIPFELKRYANISKHNFTDDDMQLDLNNIQDNEQQQMPENYNPIDLQQNPLQLMLDSLLPWVHLPNQNNNNQQQE